MDYKNHNMIIDSPRSIYICRSHGIEMEDLYYYNFFEYRNMHPDIIPLNLDIQKSHFYHDQGIREITLSKLIRERRDLIKQEETKNNLIQNKNNFENKSTNTIKNNNNEKEKIKLKSKNELERVKNKEKKELLNMLENQLRSAFIQKQNDLKLQIENEKELDKLKLLEIRRKEQEKYKEYLEKQRKLKEEKEAQEQKKFTKNILKKNKN